MDTEGLLQRLSEAFGVPGFEDEVRETIAEIVAPLVDEAHTDAMGNLICTRRGRRDEVLLLDAHMDEVGFMVSFVDEEGFLRITPLGTWDPRVLPSHAVTIRTRAGASVRGVIGTIPPHVSRPDERHRTLGIDELFVDVGRDARELGVRMGDPCVPSYGFESVSPDLVMGKAFDDRAGCTVLVRVLEELRDASLDMTLVAAFTTSEEVGLRGARTAAFQAAPTVALALEGTTAVDVPGVPGPRRASRMGAGPAITLADQRTICDRKVIALLEEAAEAHRIPYQHKVPPFGATDAGAIQTSGAGAMCGVVSVPCRYIHTPLSLLSLPDLENAVRLVTAFALTAGSIVPG